MRRQLATLVLFPFPLLSVSLLCRLADGRRTLSPFLPPLLLCPLPKHFFGFCAALMTIHVLSRCSSSGMTLRPYFIVSRPIVHVSHILRAPHYSFFFHSHIITLSAHPFADILDINTSRDPRVTSLALIVVRLQLCTIPMFLRRHSTLLIMFASCQHYETIC